METTITTDQARAIELAIQRLGLGQIEILDYLYWLKADSREDQGIIRDLKESTRKALYELRGAIYPT